MSSAEETFTTLLPYFGSQGWAASQAMKDIGGLQVAVAMPGLSRLVASRKLCEEECEPNDATNEIAKVILAYRDKCDKAAEIFGNFIFAEDEASNSLKSKTETLLMIIANHATESETVFVEGVIGNMRGQLQKLLEEASTAGKHTDFDIVNQIEGSSEFDGDVLMKLSKNQHAKRLRAIYKMATSKFKDLETFKGDLKQIGQLPRIVALVSAVHKDFAELWTSMHIVVACCLVVQAMFSRHMTGEDHETKVVLHVLQTASLLDDLLAKSNFRLPANLGLAWRAMSKDIIDAHVASEHATT
jgi:hypothetical protein